MKKDTSWGDVAEWYDDLLEENKDSYQAKVVLPNLLRLLDIQKEDRVLDFACGQGFFARAFAGAGAHVVALDISPELIAKAKEKPTEGIEYHVVSASKVEVISDMSIDKGVCVLALQNIEKFQAVLGDISRMLKQDGKFYIVLNHPAFRIPKGSFWGWDDEEGVQYRRLNSYLSESKTEIVMNPGGKGDMKTVSFHRPLQVYFKAFQKAGFSVTRLEEWTSHKESDSGPRAKAENEARKEFPLFMCLELRKS
jgi:ubiquinone/menaquinone biosynthesis C-methylase UbiE